MFILTLCVILYISFSNYLIFLKLINFNGDHNGFIISIKNVLNNFKMNKIFILNMLNYMNKVKL